MRGQFGLHDGKPRIEKPGWYRRPGSRSKVTYYYIFGGSLVEGRTLPSVRNIPEIYDSAWARGEREDSEP